jgi:glucosamine--fructose-6-phosphate aminotransferase (isomerizing)
MCGIIGYIGSREVKEVLIKGLKRLEYRGYDSAGIAAVDNQGKSLFIKSKGRIKELENKIKGKRGRYCFGLGHTRWATHVKPLKKNAHPHRDCNKRIIVVHNGIIENYQELKGQLLTEGCHFSSDTDTEVVAHLISRFNKGDLKEAVHKARQKLKGSYALGVISLDDPNKIIATKADSPLVVGVGRRENFITSDASAIVQYTKKVIYLKDQQLAEIKKDDVVIFDKDLKEIKKQISLIKHSPEAIKKEGYPHFMLKEIHQQPRVSARIISSYVKGDKITFKEPLASIADLRKIKAIKIIACGTAFYSGLAAKYILERFLRLPVEVDLGSEFRYRRPVIEENTLVIAVSQSGETADTLAAVKEAKKNKSKVIAVCNVLGSSLTRQAHSTIYTHAGPEISVASTKAYTAQLVIFYLLGLYLGRVKKTISPKSFKMYLKTLKKVPSQQKKIFKKLRKIKSIARKHLHFGAFLYLGRNINFPVALEGALKLKEISYIPAEGYAAGEMKHGPIALIDEYRAVVCVANDSFIFDKMVSNIQEILARGGKIIIISNKPESVLMKYSKEIISIPKIDNIFSPLLTVIPMQLFAYYVASLKGYDVDKPRNLAKSVTVE